MIGAERSKGSWMTLVDKDGRALYCRLFEGGICRVLELDCHGDDIGRYGMPLVIAYVCSFPHV